MNRRSFLLGAAAGAYCKGSGLRYPCQADRGLTVVNSLPSLQNPYYEWWNQGGQSFARSVGATYSVLQNQADWNKCRDQISGMITQTQGRMVLNIDLASRFSASSVAELCIDRKIFFVTHGYGVPDLHPWERNPYYVAHVGSDHALAGSKTAMSLMTAMGGRGKIVALGGLDKGAQLRKSGLDRVLATRRDCTLLDYQPADWEASVAFEIVRWWLAKYHGEIQGIWAANDTMALGAIEALRVYKSVGKIPVTGIDGLPDALTAIRDGELLTTSPWDAFYQGGFGLSLARAAKLAIIDCNKEADAHREFYLSVQIVTRDNVDDFIRYRNYRNPFVDWQNLWIRANGSIFSG